MHCTNPVAMMSIGKEARKQMDEEIITQIGTLEWNMGDRYITELDLEKIRPTIEGDKEHSTRYAGQCGIPTCKVGASHEDAKKTSIETMMVVIGYVLRIMHDAGEDGLVLLCFATHQLRWNIKIVCNAYVPQPRQVQ